MGKKQKQIIRQSFLEQVLRYGVLVLFTVLPLLYFSGRVASYVTSKQYFLIGSVAVLAVFWSWVLCADTRYRLSKKNLLMLAPLFLFLLALTVSACTGVDPATSFFSTVESGTGLVTLYFIFLFTCIVTSLIRVQQQKILKELLQAILCSSSVLAIATFFTGPNGVVDIHSEMLNKSSGGAMMGNSLLVGAYFIFAIFFAVILILQEQKPYKKVLYAIAIALMVLSPIYLNVHIWHGTAFSQLASSGYFVLGEARIAAISLVAGLLISLFIWWAVQKNRKTLRTIGITGLVLAVVLCGVAVEQVVIPTSTVHRFFVAQSGNRVIDWQEALQGIQQKPVLGWGPENYHVVFQQYLNPVILSPDHGSEVWALHPHNNTLEVLVNGGIVAFLLYLLLLGSLFSGITRLYKKNTIDGKTYALLIGMLIAFILQQQMVYDSIVSYTILFFVIASVAGLSDVSTADNTSTQNLSTQNQYIIGTAVVVVMSVAWVLLAYEPAQKMVEFQSVANAHSDARASMYQHLFHSSGSYALDTDAEFYTGPLFYSYSPEEVTLKNNPLYQKVASTELAALLMAVTPVWQHTPYDYHLTLSLIQIENLYYYLSGNAQALSQADIYAARGFVLSPTDPQIYVNYAQTLIYEKKGAAAKVLLDKALLLNPGYQPALDLRKEVQ
jgi:O-antigen ligase